MKYWFYDENGKELYTFHYTSVEQHKQFLDEFNIPYLEVGDEVENNLDIENVSENLGELLSLLKVMDIDPNDVRLGVDYEKDYDHKREFVVAYYKSEATELDVSGDIRYKFHTRFEEKKQEFKRLEWWADRLGCMMVEKEKTK